MANIHRYVFISVLTLMMSVTTVFAQQDFLLKGALGELGTPNRIAGARIYNKRTTFTSTSNTLGLFEIKAIIGDTLLIYAAEYSDSTVVVASQQDLIVKLRRGTMLREVNINIQSKKQELTDMKQDYRKKGAFYSGKPPVLAFFFKPLTALYETFGRTPKNARRFGKYYETEMQQTLIDGFFNETIIQQNTDLKDKDLEDFMINYRPEYEKAQNWANYDAIKYIKESYKSFKDSLKK
ncbi:MAG: hypothetical protein V4687_12605 [Bacteroidota bacterium]